MFGAGTAKKQNSNKAIPAVGSRAAVMHGTARHTSGSLYKTDLAYNKHGRIVSIKASNRGKKEGLRNLHRAGYVAKKGKMLLGKKMLTGRPVSPKMKKSARRSRK